MNQNAINYLKENKGKYSKDILIKQLQNSGYLEDDINEAATAVFGNDPAQAAGETKYAGFWIRWVAVLLDGIIINIAYAIIAVPLGVLSFSAAGSGGNPLADMVGLLMYPLMWAYYIIMTNKYQATLGKMALGLKVITEEGQQATLGKIALRETVGKILSCITLGIGYIMAGFTQKKKALHDMVAGTVVVYKDPGKKMKGWVIGVVIAGIVLFMIVIVGILSSIVLVSLNSAKGKAQDAAVKAAISSQIPRGIIFYDEKKSFEGFKLDNNFQMTECSGRPVVNISPDGQEIAIFGKLCSMDSKYFCADASANADAAGLTAEVDAAFVESGKTVCQ